MIFYILSKKYFNYKLYNTMFNLERATNPYALKTLTESYNLAWKGKYSMYKLINLWYYRCTKNDKRVRVRAYYAYLDHGVINYWNADFVYCVKKNRYVYVLGSGNYANSVYNGLSKEESSKLKIYFYNPNAQAEFFVFNKLVQIPE